MPRRNKSGRRWHVEYKLSYDGGGSEWVGYYRTKIGAGMASFCNVYINSWGGTAVLYDSWEE